MKISEDLAIDLPALLETRLLVQANSGGGKSWLLRRLLEQTAKKVQQIVIDPEGEFSTLRERFDYVICAPQGGDAVAHPSSASLLARRLLETGVSAVLNIYDLKAHERQRFVRVFCEELVNAPKALWHPVLVVLDEAHVFCPEKGSAESSGAVNDLATRGRKRGFCLVMATQRLSKLHKDAAAEMVNKLVGRTGLDIDVKRAADELGFSGRDDSQSLRHLKSGEFYAFGPAFCQEVRRITVGPVQTTHPRSGHRMLSAPPEPSAKIKALLAKGLQDLPKEAEREARSMAELKEELRQTRASLTRAETAAKAQGVPEAEVQKRIQSAVRDAREQEQGIRTINVNPKLRPLLEKALEMIDVKPDQYGHPPISIKPGSGHSPRAMMYAKNPVSAAVSDGATRPQQRILDVLAQLEAYGIEMADKAMVAAHAGCSITSGAYANNLGRLRTLGLIDYPQGGTVALTEIGRATANKPDRAPTLDELHRSWLQIVPAPQARILEALISKYPDSIQKENLAQFLGVSETSGAYANNLGRLRTMGAIEYPQRGFVQAAAILFPKSKP